MGTEAERAEGRGRLPGVEKAVERESARQQKLLALFLAIMVLSIGGAVAFAIFGRSDVERIRGEAKAEVEEVILGPETPATERDVRQALRAATEAGREFENFEWDGKKRRMTEVLREVASGQNELGTQLEERLEDQGRIIRTESEKIQAQTEEIRARTEEIEGRVEKLAKKDPDGGTEMLAKQLEEMRTQNRKALELLQLENAKARAELQAENAKARAELENELRKTKAALDGWQDRVKELSTQLKTADERIQKLEGRRPERPEIPRRPVFDLKTWQTEVDKRIAAIQPRERARIALGDLLKEARDKPEIYHANGTKSVQEALDGLDARMRTLRRPR